MEEDYSAPIHKSLQMPNLFLGIPMMALLAMYCVAILTIYIMQISFFWIVIGIMYIAARMLSKRDPFLIDIVTYSMMEKDEYIP